MKDIRLNTGFWSHEAQLVGLVYMLHWTG